ncbi:DUF1707 domain-containing protein [Nocardia sp. NBC_01388]|uniref:DUF1707 SHOCT-like domain-containing protein n=1 Tax=Nocardia sp. NBC_01388 TaxID=2903596 RepID=UPI003244676E
MEHNLGVRASDADRERVVETLSAEVSTGRLTLDEFSERSSRAYGAQTVGDLESLTRDLPVSLRTAAGAAAHPSIPAVPVALIAAIALLIMLSVTVLIWMNTAMQHMGPMMGH